MIILLGILNIIASSAEQAVRYLAHHLDFSGLYYFPMCFAFATEAFYSRFSALDKRVDEIRKRLACDIRCTHSARKATR
jgi:hypothetical protein